MQRDHLKLIVFYYHFVPAMYSAVHCIDGEKKAVALFFSQILIQLCASLCKVSHTVLTHPPICVWVHRARLLVDSIASECICSRTVENSLDVLRCTSGLPAGTVRSVSRFESGSIGEDWNDLKTSNFSNLMHRLHEDSNLLQPSIPLAPAANVCKHMEEFQCLCEL